MQQLYAERLINCGHLGYKFNVDDTPDVEKADQRCFDLAL
jgi:hypothetical protein